MNNITIFFSVVFLAITVYYISLSKKAFEQFYTYSCMADKRTRKKLFVFKRNITAVLICSGFLSLSAALASPDKMEDKELLISPGIDTVHDYAFVIDISNSMTADDGGSSRLEKVRNLILSFMLSDTKNSRYSVSVFKGSSVVLLPLTSDKKVAASVIEKLSPNMFTSSGTAISPAVASALELFPDHEKSERNIIIFTDGEETEAGSLEKNINMLSGLISSRNISVTVVMPDIGSGSMVLTGKDNHVSIPDFDLMEKAIARWGGNLVKISDFSEAKTKKAVHTAGIRVNKTFFLVFSFIFLVSAYVLGRMQL